MKHNIPLKINKLFKPVKNTRIYEFLDEQIIQASKNNSIKKSENICLVLTF